MSFAEDDFPSAGFVEVGEVSSSGSYNLLRRSASNVKTGVEKSNGLLSLHKHADTDDPKS